MMRRGHYTRYIEDIIDIIYVILIKKTKTNEKTLMHLTVA